MKKMTTAFLFILMILALSACSGEMKTKIEGIKPEPAVEKEAVKEKENELTFEVNGKTKTIPARIRKLSMTDRQMKLSENFTVNEDPQGSTVFHHKEHKISFSFREEDKIGSDTLYDLFMHYVAGIKDKEQTEPFKEFTHPSLKGDYAFAKQGEGQEKKGILLIKKTEKKPLDISIQFYKPYPENQDEILAEIVAMISTLE